MENRGLLVNTIFCCHYCWTGGRMDRGRTNRKKDRRTDGWMAGVTDRQTDGKTDRQMDGQSDEQTD